MMKYITTPFTAQQARTLEAGDSVRITGTIYTARDAAHKRLVELVEKGESLPFDPMDAIIFFVGPTPAKPGQAMGSAGPTTSYRMDAYSPTLLRLGLRGMVGKGKRSPEVIEAMKANDGVYFGAVGGAGALLGRCVQKSELVAYPDLGAEAILRLEVVDFPAVVVIDHLGNNLYESGPKAYLETLTTK